MMTKRKPQPRRVSKAARSNGSEPQAEAPFKMRRRRTNKNRRELGAEERKLKTLRMSQMKADALRFVAEEHMTYETDAIWALVFAEAKRLGWVWRNRPHPPTRENFRAL